MVKEKSVDEIFVTVSLSLREIHIINEGITASLVFAGISTHSDMSTHPVVQLYQRLIEKLIDAVQSAELPGLDKDAAVEYVSDTYFRQVLGFEEG